MKFKKFFLILLIVVTGNLLFTGCNKKEELAYEADADVYIKKQLVNGEIKYTAVINAISVREMKQVTVVPPTGSEFNLTQVAGSATTYYKKITENDYSSSIPTVGTYTFKVVFNDDVTYTTTDILDDDEIGLPVITECKWDAANNAVYVVWNALDNADVYNVNIYNANKELMFSSGVGNSSSTSIYITSSTYSWFLVPTNNQPITVELNAYLLENSASSTDWMVNLQCASSTTRNVVWFPSN